MANRRLLIVEDHAATLRALQGIFRARGYEVVTAATRADGLASLDPPPCCLVLDLMLPDGPGEDILRKVRDDGLPTRVAVCTGCLDRDRIEAVAAMGARAVLFKPIDVEDVFRACEAG